MNHANDTSSAAVRAQAINGISLLLDAEQSHAVLRPLLPLLGNLIWISDMSRIFNLPYYLHPFIRSI